MKYEKLESLPLAPEDKANILLIVEGVKPLGDVILKKNIPVLSNPEDGKRALDYLKKRGKFPGSEDITIQDMKKLREEVKDLFEKLGLFYYPEDGDLYTISKDKSRLLEFRTIMKERKIVRYSPLSGITPISEEKLFIYHDPCVWNSEKLILCAESFRLGRSHVESIKLHSQRIYMERLLGCCIHF